MTTKVFLLLGGMRGPDGYVDSAGMLALKPRLEDHGVSVEVHTWDRYRDAETSIQLAFGRSKIVIVGYSGGGSRATDLARELRYTTIDLIVGYDPSPAGETYPLFTNVRRALCYHNQMQDLIVPFIGRLGGGRYVADGGAALPIIETMEINQPHLSVQANEQLHARTVKEILAL